MVCARDGRPVGARRNGACHVSVEDDRRYQYLLDFGHAKTLADALDSGKPVSFSDCSGQVLTFNGTRLGLHGDEPYVDDSNPVHGPLIRGPWELGADERVRLAAEIREAVQG